LKAPAPGFEPEAIRCVEVTTARACHGGAVRPMAIYLSELRGESPSAGQHRGVWPQHRATVVS